jgi:phosphoribosylaminoimidazole-succinocarboxamide synthase
MLFFQLQRLFERIGIRFVDFKSEIGFLDPLSRGVYMELRVAEGNLLDRDKPFS